MSAVAYSLKKRLEQSWLEIFCNDGNINNLIRKLEMLNCAKELHDLSSALNKMRIQNGIDCKRSKNKRTCARNFY